MLHIKNTGIIFYIILILLLDTGGALADNPGRSGGGQWFITGRSGMAMLLTEVSNDLVILDNEFNHKPGLALDLSAGRTIGKHFESSLSLGIYRLSGDSDLPEFSANGIHPAFLSVFPGPVEYATVSTTISGVFRYLFREYSLYGGKKMRLDPYAEFGLGVNYFFTQVGYKNPPQGIPDVIFQKGTGEKPRPGPGNVIQYTAGVGTKIQFPQNLSLILSLNTDLVNYDCMDAVHNYTDGERNHAKTIIPKLMLGVIVPVGGNRGSGGSLWGP